MMAILVILIFILLIGLKFGVLIYILKKDKQKNNPPADEDILDGRM